MPEISLTDAEVEVLAGYINEDNDGIDLYPGALDPATLMTAAEEIELLRQAGGRGTISPTSASLASSVLAFFLESFRPMMQPDDVEATESVVAKLSAVGPD